jgi:predicted transcriptional regulator
MRADDETFSLNGGVTALRGRPKKRSTVRNLTGYARPETRAGYTIGMKTAISIPDDVFLEAERLAAELKQSRSQLYSRAVREYVARHSANSITATLDAVCRAQADSGSGFVRAASRGTLERTEW